MEDSLHYIKSVLLVLSLGVALLSCASGSPEVVQSVSWPRFGPELEALELSGHTNSAPDFIGPLDGSAKITVLTEGNHFPALLPLIFEGFIAHCQRLASCDVKAHEVLVITLPQVMLLEAMKKGHMRLGNAIVPLRRASVYPDIVMGGEGVLRELAMLGEVEPTGTIIAKHQGLGLLFRRSYLSQAPQSELARMLAKGRVVVATPREAGARGQYKETLRALLGEQMTQEVFSREVVTFPGRLDIQHRDVPYALLTGQADVGLIFGHLAKFYAQTFSSQLLWVPVKEAARFGRTIAMARSTHAPENAAARFLSDFIVAQAKQTYPAFGFAHEREFDYGRQVSLLSP